MDVEEESIASLQIYIVFKNIFIYCILVIIASEIMWESNAMPTKDCRYLITSL